MKAILALSAGLALFASAPALTARASTEVAFAIPQANPQGDLQIESLGVADLGPQSIQALQVRMVLANQSRAPWTVDTRQQRIDLEGYGASVPAFATADAGQQPPVVTVPPGGRRVVDLFYPLPSDLQSEGELPVFDMLWSVDSDVGAIAERTPFESIATVTAPPVDTYAPDLGEPYWYNPIYPQSGFGVVIPPAYFGGRLRLQHRDHGERFVPRGQFHRGNTGAVRGAGPRVTPQRHEQAHPETRRNEAATPRATQAPHAVQAPRVTPAPHAVEAPRATPAPRAAPAPHAAPAQPARGTHQRH